MMINKLLDIKKYWILALVLSLTIFMGGLMAWLLARGYIPTSPKPTPSKTYVFTSKQPIYPLTKYQPLFSGTLFFGVSAANGPGSFHSRLILWGTSGGWAIIGLDPQSNQTTWLVKDGFRIEDEVVETVGSGFVVVRNPTGEGKVYLTE